MVGLDDGTKNYLGRKKPIKKKSNDPLAKAIFRKRECLKATRQKTEHLRREACSCVKHRPNEYSNSDCPIKPVKLYNTAGIEAFEKYIKGYHGNLLVQTDILEHKFRRL